MGKTCCGWVEISVDGKKFKCSKRSSEIINIVSYALKMGVIISLILGRKTLSTGMYVQLTSQLTSTCPLHPKTVNKTLSMSTALAWNSRP